jgi:hypothetical protein
LYEGLPNFMLPRILNICCHDFTYIMARFVSLWLRLCRPSVLAQKFIE